MTGAIIPLSMLPIILILVGSNPVRAFSVLEPCPSSRPNGIYAHPTDCSAFITCIDGMSHITSCDSSLHFNPEEQVCDWPENVRCSPGSHGNEMPSANTYDTSKHPGGRVMGKLFDQFVKGTAPYHCQQENSAIAVSEDCGLFMRCNQWRPHLMTCAEGRSFSPRQGRCVEGPPENPLCTQRYEFRCLTPNGLFPDSSDRTKYYNCWNYRWYHQTCPEELVFNAVRGWCDFPWNSEEFVPPAVDPMGNGIPMAELQQSSGAGEPPSFTMPHPIFQPASGSIQQQPGMFGNQHQFSGAPSSISERRGPLPNQEHNHNTENLNQHPMPMRIQPPRPDFIPALPQPQSGQVANQQQHLELQRHTSSELSFQQQAPFQQQSFELSQNVPQNFADRQQNQEAFLSTHQQFSSPQFTQSHQSTGSFEEQRNPFITTAGSESPRTDTPLSFGLAPPNEEQAFRNFQDDFAKSQQPANFLENRQDLIRNHWPAPVTQLPSINPTGTPFAIPALKILLEDLAKQRAQSAAAGVGAATGELPTSRSDFVGAASQANGTMPDFNQRPRKLHIEFRTPEQLVQPAAEKQTQVSGNQFGNFNRFQPQTDKSPKPFGSLEEPPVTKPTSQKAEQQSTQEFMQQSPLNSAANRPQTSSSLLFAAQDKQQTIRPMSASDFGLMKTNAEPGFTGTNFSSISNMQPNQLRQPFDDGASFVPTPFVPMTSAEFHSKLTSPAALANGKWSDQSAAFKDWKPTATQQWEQGVTLALSASKPQLELEDGSRRVAVTQTANTSGPSFPTETTAPPTSVVLATSSAPLSRPVTEVKRVGIRSYFNKQHNKTAASPALLGLSINRFLLPGGLL